MNYYDIPMPFDKSGEYNLNEIEGRHFNDDSVCTHFVSTIKEFQTLVYFVCLVGRRYSKSQHGGVAHRTVEIDGIEFSSQPSNIFFFLKSLQARAFTSMNA